jgi:cobalt/nickel transport system ATP-binding protein
VKSPTFDNPTPTPQPHRGTLRSNVECILTLDQVSFQYPGGPLALHSLNLRVHRGESVAVLGANGCGKSTLLSILDGLLFPTGGVYEAFGVRITEEGLAFEEFNRYFRSRVALVLQNSDVQLFCPSVRDELSFGPLQLDLPQEQVLERSHDVLALLEISHLADRAPFSLSGGEKKKVAIASVLTMNPEVLLLDEPGNELDPRTQAWLIEFLLQLKESGKTLMIATHDLGMVDEVADRAIVLDEDHRLLADGPTDEVLANSDLLLKANLIHEHFHRHGGVQHRHLHRHNVGHEHEH